LPRKRLYTMQYPRGFQMSKHVGTDKFILISITCIVIHCMTASGVKRSEFLATDAEVRVPFPALQDFLRTSGSGMDSLSLVRIIEELFQGNSGSGLENLN
jgi:hypothetical protein